MSLQHIQKNSPRLLPKPAKFEKNPPNGYRVIRKRKCGAAGAGGAGSSPIHKQASLAGRLINFPQEASHSFLGFFFLYYTNIHAIYIFTYLLIFGLGGGGPVGQPPQALNEKALYQRKPHPSNRIA